MRGELFWKNISDTVPGHSLAGQRSKLIYVTQKFFNFFDSSVNQKVFFRALATVQELVASGDASDKKQAHNILEHLIKGEFVQRFGGIPPQFNAALNSFKTFFLNNVQSYTPELMESTWPKQ